jgi:hypothetical protein
VPRPRPGVAAAFLSTVTGHEVQIAASVRKRGLESLRVSAQLDAVPVASVLSDVLTTPYDLGWEIEHGVSWIRTRAEIDAPLRLRYFDVKDLVAEGRGRALDALVEAIRREVRPASWDAANVHVEGRNGILIVRASRGTLRDLDAWLTQQRAVAGVGLPARAGRSGQ